MATQGHDGVPQKPCPQHAPVIQVSGHGGHHDAAPGWVKWFSIATALMLFAFIAAWVYVTWFTSAGSNNDTVDAIVFSGGLVLDGHQTGVLRVVENGTQGASNTQATTITTSTVTTDGVQFGNGISIAKSTSGTEVSIANSSGPMVSFGAAGMSETKTREVFSSISFVNGVSITSMPSVDGSAPYLAVDGALSSESFATSGDVTLTGASSTLAVNQGNIQFGTAGASLTQTSGVLQVMNDGDAASMVEFNTGSNNTTTLVADVTTGSSCDVTFTTAPTITDTLNLSGGLSVTGTITAQDALQVNGDATFAAGQTVTMAGQTDHTGGVTITGGLSVQTGAANLSSATTFGGAVTCSGAVDLNGGTSIGSGQQLTFMDGTSTGAVLSYTESSGGESALGIAGDVALQNLHASGSIVTDGNLSAAVVTGSSKVVCGGDAEFLHGTVFLNEIDSLASSITVSKPTTFTDTATVNQDLDIGGDVFYSGCKLRLIQSTGKLSYQGETGSTPVPVWDINCDTGATRQYNSLYFGPWTGAAEMQFYIDAAGVFDLRRGSQPLFQTNSDSDFVVPTSLLAQKGAYIDVLPGTDPGALYVNGILTVAGQVACSAAYAGQMFAASNGDAFVKAIATPSSYVNTTASHIN